MPKNAVADWDTTAGNNTDIGGINIAEGMSPGNVNDAMREMMSQLKTYSGLPIATAGIGDGQVTFPKLASAAVATTITASATSVPRTDAIKAYVDALNGGTKATIGVGQPITDCNSIAEPGFYYVLANALNRPLAGPSQGVFLLQIVHTAEARMQLAFRHGVTASTTYVRQQVTVGEGYGPWFEFGGSRSATLATTSGANVFIAGTTTDWTEVDIILDGIRWGTSPNARLRFATFPGGVIDSGYRGTLYANAGGSGFFVESTAEAFAINRSTVGTIIDGHLRCVRSGTNVWAVSGYYTRRGESYQAVNAIHATLANPMSEVLLQVAGAGEFNAGAVHYNWKT